MAVKTIVIQVYAVGIYHYGRKELHVGVGYKLKRESENKYHANAVSMHDRDSDRKVSYLQRKYADKISPIMSAGLATKLDFTSNQSSKRNSKINGWDRYICAIWVSDVLKKTLLTFKQC